MTLRGLLLLLPFALVPARAEPDGEESPEPLVLAVIVHPKNPVTKVSFNELRAYLKIERQFWPNRKRCQVYLPQSSTDAYDVLLTKVYRMSHRKLQKYWVRRLFSGEIPAKPSYVPSAKAAGEQVLKSEGALCVVPATEVPEDVRVLLVDGKKPADDGYPLAAVPRRDSEP